MDVLESKRLILRKWKKSDSKDMYEFAKSERVGPYAGWPPHRNIRDSKRLIKMFIRSNDTYAIVLKSENKVIGSIGMYNRSPDGSLFNLNQREIGYVLNPQYWGRGIMPEAVKCLIDYGFTKLNLDLIWCGHFKYNEKSKRVIEKCGFKYTLTKNEVLELLNNKEVIIFYYSVCQPEYINNLYFE